jgi:hypothetical protein
MWDGDKVINERGDVYWFEKGVFFKHPVSNPKITIIVGKFYADLLQPDYHEWQLYDDTASVE